MPTPSPSFDLAEATRHLAERDECLKRLIAETVPFQMDQDHLQSPYEALLEAIAYQSISGKAAATIYGRIKALSATGRAPTPQEMLKLRKPVLRKAGLSGAKILAMKDLAKKTLDGEDFCAGEAGFAKYRSEEHTSELQSQSNLVCRLLLEKKKTQTKH